MSLGPGTRIGVYDVATQIGAGGMGEVYRARDTRLGRDIALKILPSDLLSDPDRLVRFRREAQVLAALNHPGIAAIYGIEESEGIRAIVMELVPGPTLRERLERGPVAPPDAIAFASQIAAALAAAHEQDIIHRDLKPANIIIRPDGIVKLLDFGLAKTPSVQGPVDGPTISVHATRPGSVLGTAAYMSPEQARGQAVDKRADIWAFGAVLFEMLSGKRAFSGDTVTDVLAAVVTREPDWQALPPSTPASLRRLLVLCLKKDPQHRVRDISDTRLLLDDVGDVAKEESTSTVQGRWVRRLAWLVGGMAIGAMVIGAWRPRVEVTAALPVRLKAELGAAVGFPSRPEFQAAVSISPDGTRLAFAGEAGGRVQLYVRPLTSVEAQPLPGTEGAQSPFFCPDGQWIAFFASGKLKKVNASGGPVVTLADAPDPRGGAWGADDTLAFMPGGSAGTHVLGVSAAGGDARSLTHPAPGDITHRWPQFLPDGRGLLYTSATKTGGYNDADLVVESLSGGSRTVVHRGGYFGRYLESGHLVFVRDRTLMAAPFDLARLAITGAIVPVLASLRTTPTTGAAEVSVSHTGTMVYLSAARGSSQFSWIDRAGRVTPVEGDTSNWGQPRISPDGRRVAVTIGGDGQSDIWIADLTRPSAMTRLTADRASIQPVWTPDGQRIVYASRRDRVSGRNLYWQRADGSGDAQRLTQSPHDQSPVTFHPNGRLLALAESRQSADILMLRLDGDDESGWKPGGLTPFLDGPSHELGAMFSPDGRWLAYQSQESGAAELQVRRYPGPGGSRVVSSGGAAVARWSVARPELIYRAADQVHVVGWAVQGDAIRFDPPQPWPNARIGRNLENAGFFDLHPDGQRLLLNGLADSSAGATSPTINFVLNFSDELRRVAPPK